MTEMTLDATLDNLNTVLEFIDGTLESMDCPMRTQTQIDIAVEEIFVNIASYAYAPGTGPATIRLEPCSNPASLTITFMDSGVPYDPLKKDDPDITLSAEERPIGGLGIFMVKKSMDEMTYVYENGMNVLSIRKNL